MQGLVQEFQRAYEEQHGNGTQDLRDELKTVEACVAWALIAEKEAHIPPANRRQRGDAANRREIREWLDRMIPVVEETYGPRQLDPEGRSKQALKIRQKQLEQQLPPLEDDLIRAESAMCISGRIWREISGFGEPTIAQAVAASTSSEH